MGKASGKEYLLFSQNLNGQHKSCTYVKYATAPFRKMQDTKVFSKVTAFFFEHKAEILFIRMQ
jgi:hypothetical protein